MWISTKGLSRKDEEVVVNFIRKKLKKKLIFVGHCFGSYDLIVEFEDDSGKVASNTVCFLQEKLGKELRARLKRLYNPICSSLILGNKLIYPGRAGKKDNNLCPLRTYTFLYPKKSTINLEEISGKLDHTMNLFWIASSFAFLLICRGNNFSKLFGKILDFRRGTEPHFRESCTYVGLHFWKDDEPVMEPIRALVFLKLRKGFGEFKLKRRKNEHEDWNPPEKRLGWSDICLTPKNKYTLRGLKDAILKLRENHRKDLITTATLLLPKEG